jgi:hypothetical protein
MYKPIQKEIVEIHQFFQGWFNGLVSNDEKIFERLTRVLADGFTLITPRGKLIDREEMISSLQSAYHSRKGMRIWIEKVQILHRFGEITMVSYEEWQLVERDVTVRLSSAIFKFQPGAPNKVVWLHVHETWMHSPADNHSEIPSDQQDYEPKYPHDRP